MNEKIIIDGVDVAGCVNYVLKEHSEYYCKTYGKDCYYKQLKRLEQENARLKKEILHQSDEILMLSAYKEEVEVLEKERKKNNQYKQALLEIKDTLNKVFNVCDNDCGNASGITIVVNRISEVLDED